MMEELDVAGAFAYYRDHIFREDLFALLRAYGLSVTGCVPSVLWELFGAILTRDKAKGGYGSDLMQHEIKSAVEGNSFEYQYHLHGGLTKLDEDALVNHVFVSYSPDYRKVTVRLVHGEMLRPVFERWRPGLIENYSGPNRKLRYRKSIAFGLVVRHGIVVMQIEDGALLLP